MFHTHVFPKFLGIFSEHKQLRGGVYFVNSLAITDSGKISRHLMTKQAIKLYKNNIIN